MDWCHLHYLRMWRNGTTDTVRNFSKVVGDKRLCTRCHQFRTFDLFAFNPTEKRYVGPCKVCLKQIRQIPIIKERKRAVYRAWRKKNEARLGALNQHNYVQYRDALKNDWLAAYGGKCSCCGETIPEFLTVEHLKGDGKVHRKAAGTGLRMLVDMRRNGWPQDRFTILCYNCNCAKGHSKTRTCPHERISNARNDKCG